MFDHDVTETTTVYVVACKACGAPCRWDAVAGQYAHIEPEPVPEPPKRRHVRTRPPVIS